MKVTALQNGERLICYCLRYTRCLAETHLQEEAPDFDKFLSSVSLKIAFFVTLDFLSVCHIEGKCFPAQQPE